MNLIKNIKVKAKQLFHQCSAVQEVYPRNAGNMRIVECVECGKYHLLDTNDKSLKEAKIKSFRQISIYIKNRKD